MLFRDIARETLPALQIGRNGSFVFARPDAAGGRRGDNEENRCAVQRCHCASEAVPGVFTNQYSRSAPLRIEGANLEPAIDESFLVEQPVRRQEELPVHVTDDRLSPSPAQRHIERTIIEGVVPHLVKPNAHIERP